MTIAPPLQTSASTYSQPAPGMHGNLRSLCLYSGFFISMLLCQNNAQAQLCTASAIAPLFGNYQSAGSGSNANGSVSVSCLVPGITPQNVFYTIELELNGQAQLTQRRMVFGTNYLNYNVFCDGGYSQVWADGSGSSCTVTGGQAGLLGTLLTVSPVYGRIPGGQFLSPGTYTDSITVKVLY